MASLSSVEERIQGLASRLQAENESQNASKSSRNLTLDFSRERPGSERRPRPTPILNIDRPNTISARPGTERLRIDLYHFQPQRQDYPPELSALVKEIKSKNGVITIDGKKYYSKIDDMEYVSELGNGTSGTVVKMLHKPSSKMVAVKQMHLSDNREETKRVFFDLEVLLKSSNSPYIVQCLGYFVTDADVSICMELMATCLDKLIKKYKKPLPEGIIGKIAVATIKALNYLKESHGVIHRDVKPSNILLDEKGSIKLCDFGISGRLVDSKAKTRSAGCTAYMAPERIDPPDPKKPDYDIRADVWSLGITLVELAIGHFPYTNCKTDFELLTKVLQEASPTLPADKGFSSEFQDFVKNCLIKDYKDRPKYRKLLEHPFIKKYDKENVDVTSWFSDINHLIERKIRNSTQKQSIFSSPLLPRASRAVNRQPFSTNDPPVAPIPPPVAPRRRSRTPDSSSQERLIQNLQYRQQKQQHMNSFVPSRSQVPLSSKLESNSSSPSRGLSSFSISSNSHYPHHQYALPSTSHSTSTSYSPNPYSYASSSYSNPYSHSLHSWTPHAKSTNYFSGDHFPLSSQTTSGQSNTSYGFLRSQSGSSSGSRRSSSGKSGCTPSPPSSQASVVRKTPEPVRFNPEPWAPRGRFAQPAHSRSLSYDFSSRICSSLSQYQSSYLPPHVSPLVSRKLAEQKASKAALDVVGSSTNPFNTHQTHTQVTPHYRYQQEAQVNSRPYYTPEPQRRIFPRFWHR